MRDYWSRNPDKYKAMRERYRVRRKQNPARDFLQRIRSRAKSAGMDFDLDEADFAILPTHCPVLGIELNYDGGRHDPALASVDRIDNTKGYVRGNIIVVSYRANALKRDASLEEMRRILAFYEPLLRDVASPIDRPTDIISALLLAA